MQSAAQRSSIDKVLMAHGLGRLRDGAGLVAQLAYLTRDHDHFRSLLNRCEPTERRNMYEAMRPYLRFDPKPLDVYISELAMDAEARQLPTIGEGGKFVPYSGAPEIVSEAQDALDEGLAKGHLTLTCRKCTRTETFAGYDKADAVKKAREAGWIYSALGEGVEICPDCPVSTRCI